MVHVPNYELSQKIYESVNSIIYRGVRQADRQPVILKLPASEPSPQQILQFTNEVEFTKGLNLKGIRRAIEATTVDEHPAIILEYVPGQNLKQAFGGRRRSPIDFLTVAIQLAHIVGEVHQHHLIHRDINPSNIIVAFAEQPPFALRNLTLIDFGLASRLSLKLSNLGHPDKLEGTLAYISPEQTGRMNRSVDYRTDLYSLGVTFYELLTGRVPFEAEDSMELVHCHLAKIPAPPCEIIDNSQLTIDHSLLAVLSDIILKLMAKNAEDRYQSAFGLQYDLEQVLTRLRPQPIPRPLGEARAEGEFELAQHDFSERFQIPQKLYGREQEIAMLLAAFDRIANPQATRADQQSSIEMLLVAGYAGIGKSALVNEIHKPIVARRGYFISGKFDQFKRNIPYFALIQAFQGFLRQLLTESETHLARWKEKLLTAVGSNGQVLIDVIPEIELILGPQPVLPELPPAQAQNRFNFVFQNFVQACAAAEHPLVIFLDDLQWADSPSIKLIELFMTDPATRFVLIIGAYRDNEVTGAHPLMLMLATLRKFGAIFNTMTLTPLALEHVTHLLIDTLKCTPEHAVPLAEVSLRKTGGNPFFLTQFLHALYAERFLTCDLQQGVWGWDVDAIRATAMTDNVVELMVNKIQKLSGATQHILQFAACIGNQFDLQTLSIVYEHPPIETLHDLWKALQEELIVPLDEAYKYVGIADETLHPKHPPTNPHFKFIHDRVQQAAYSLVEEPHKHSIHLKIGRLLLAHLSKGEREEKIFDLVNHLNISRTLCASQLDKDELAALNLMAGKKAKASAAFQAAFEYLQTAIELLGDASWQRNYDLTLAVYTQGTETAYLSGAFGQMDVLAQVVLENAASLLDTAPVYVIKIEASSAQNKDLEAVKIGLQVLKLLGIAFPQRPTRRHLWYALLKTQIALAGTHLEDVVALPEMIDTSMLAAVQILSRISLAADYTAPRLYPLIALKLLRLSLKYGYTSASAGAFARYGQLLCGVKHDFERGARFGQVALQILEQRQTKDPNTVLLVHFFLTHWKEHCRNTLQPLLDAYHSALEIGNFVYASQAQSIHVQNSCFIGEELTDLARKITTLRESLTRMKNERFLLVNAMHRQVVLNLIDPSETAAETPPYMLRGSSYQEDRLIPVHQQANDRSAICLLHCYKLILAVLFQTSAEAVKYAVIAESLLTPGASSLAAVIFTFYGSLARLGHVQTVGPTERKRLLKKVNNDQKTMKIWARHAPMNFLHKWYLVEAERARVRRDDLKAMEYYDQAIAGAREHAYVNEEALACELAGKFYLERGRPKIAQLYVHDAHSAYQRWRALAKVHDIEERYPELFAQKPHIPPTTSVTGIQPEALDLSTVMKASQTLSGEIQLERLLQRLMQIVIENAGAEHGFLLLPKGDDWFIEAEGHVDQGQIEVLHGIPIRTREMSEPLHVAEGIVNYVIRTKEPVVLHDAQHEGNFTHDTYITTYQVQSVLCLPLLHQGQLTAILYLENNLTPAHLRRNG